MEVKVDIFKTTPLYTGEYKILLFCCAKIFDIVCLSTKTHEHKIHNFENAPLLNSRYKKNEIK